jgi:hypothetical protein
MNRGVSKELTGATPASTTSTTRLNEINSFLNEKLTRNFLIIDDDNSLQELDKDRKASWIKTDPLIGFDRAKLEYALAKIKKWL